jgi:hypothetical protein
MTDTESGVRNALGWFLMVLASLWLLLTGGCTMVALISVIGSAVVSGAAGGGFGSLGVVLIFGGIGIAPGLLVFWLGWRLARRKVEREP